MGFQNWELSCKLYGNYILFLQYIARVYKTVFSLSGPPKIHLLTYQENIGSNCFIKYEMSGLPLPDVSWRLDGDALSSVLHKTRRRTASNSTGCLINRYLSECSPLKWGWRSTNSIVLFPALTPRSFDWAQINYFLLKECTFMTLCCVKLQQLQRRMCSRKRTFYPLNFPASKLILLHMCNFIVLKLLIFTN